jgi:hypothetical protein
MLEMCWKTESLDSRNFGESYKEETIFVITDVDQNPTNGKQSL